MEPTKEEAQQYLDLKEYQSRFLLDPAIKLGPDFQHLDKNLAITNLEHKHKLGINEPDQARALLRGLHVLNNPELYTEKIVTTLIGFENENQKDGSIIQRPVYREEKIKVPKYPRTYHNLRSEFLSFVNTAAARGGHRMNAAISNRLVKEETIAEKTNVKGGVFRRNYPPQQRRYQ